MLKEGKFKSSSCETLKQDILMLFEYDDYTYSEAQIALKSILKEVNYRSEQSLKRIEEGNGAYE